MSDPSATDDQARRARDWAQEASRDDITTFLDLQLQNSDARASTARIPSLLSETLTVVSTLQQTARDFTQWRDRVELAELSEMNQCWRNLLAADRLTRTGPLQNDRYILEAVHEMKALRIRLLQKESLASVTELTGDEVQRESDNQILARIREAQDKFLRACDAEELGQLSADGPELYPLSVSLMPAQLLLVATQRLLERGLSTHEEAEASLARALHEGEAVVAERRASGPEPASHQSNQPTLQQLRIQFESLNRQIGASEAARSALFDGESVKAMLKVITALESRQQLSVEQLRGFCGQLQGQFLELEKAFECISRL